MLHKSLSAVFGTLALVAVVWLSLAQAPDPGEGPVDPPAPPAPTLVVPTPVPVEEPPELPAIDPVDAWLATKDEIAILAGAGEGTEAERLAAVEALIRLDTPMARESLRAIAEDGGQLWAVREAARAALPKPKPPPLVIDPPPPPPPPVDPSGRSAEEWVSAWLTASHTGTRRDAARALERIAADGHADAVARAVIDGLSYESWAAQQPWGSGALVPIGAPWHPSDARRIRTSLGLWQDHCRRTAHATCVAQIDEALATL